ncbi:hypothetical protein V6Z11_D06G161000 [Gossypium hirsutum]
MDRTTIFRETNSVTSGELRIQAFKLRVILVMEA